LFGHGGVKILDHGDAHVLAALHADNGGVFAPKGKLDRATYRYLIGLGGGMTTRKNRNMVHISLGKLSALVRMSISD
jgi:hypothetical protein